MLSSVAKGMASKKDLGKQRGKGSQGRGHRGHDTDRLAPPRSYMYVEEEACVCTLLVTTHVLSLRALVQESSKRLGYSSVVEHVLSMFWAFVTSTVKKKKKITITTQTSWHMWHLAHVQIYFYTFEEPSYWVLYWLQQFAIRPTGNKCPPVP